MTLTKWQKRKIRIVWTCSDFARHKHKWKWTATICGRIQFIWSRIKLIFKKDRRVW
jgi:hypothetical protein